MPNTAAEPLKSNNCHYVSGVLTAIIRNTAVSWGSTSAGSQMVTVPTFNVNLLQQARQNDWYQQTNLQRDTKYDNIVSVCLTNKGQLEMSISTAIEMERISQVG